MKLSVFLLLSATLYPTTFYASSSYNELTDVPSNNDTSAALQSIQQQRETRTATFTSQEFTSSSTHTATTFLDNYDRSAQAALLRAAQDNQKPSATAACTDDNESNTYAVPIPSTHLTTSTTEQGTQTLGYTHEPSNTLIVPTFVTSDAVNYRQPRPQFALSTRIVCGLTGLIFACKTAFDSWMFYNDMTSPPQNSHLWEGTTIASDVIIATTGLFLFCKEKDKDQTL